MKYLNLCHKYDSEPKRILSFVARRRSGKTYLAEQVLKLDPRFSKQSFADPLKSLYAEYKGVEVSKLSDPKFKEEYRQGLIDFSWRIKNDKGMFFFACEFMNFVEGKSYVVCDDLRIIEELQILCMLGGVVYKIVASDAFRRENGYKFDPVIDVELSETELADLSAETFLRCSGGGCIFNSKNVEDVTKQLQGVIAKDFPYRASEHEMYGKLVKSFKMEL